jgi:hypothetical protein
LLERGIQLFTRILDRPLKGKGVWIGSSGLLVSDHEVKRGFIDGSYKAVTLSEAVCGKLGVVKRMIPAMKAILVVSLVVATLIQSHAQGFGQTTTTATAAAAPPSAGNDARERFASGLLSEEGEGDLAAAAAAYRQAIQEFDRQRDEAANAIFRLGEVYRKMGADRSFLQPGRLGSPEPGDQSGWDGAADATAKVALRGIR